MKNILETKEATIFYHLYPLGFSGAPERNSFNTAPEPRLNKIVDWIPHMKSLGINALYLGPVFESTAHGYDTKDYFMVDRRLGDNDTLKWMVAELHKNEIAVVLDGVFNHVGRDFWAFRDVQEKGQASRFCPWFKGLDFSRHSPYGDPFTYAPWNGHYDLVSLNLQEIEVRQHLLHAVQMWISDFEIDGIRLDAADCVSLEFQRELSAFCKKLKPGFFLLGEVIHGDYTKWVNNETLDSVTNYECYKGIYSSHNDKNYFEIAYSLNRQFGRGGLYQNMPLYAFVDNHDVDRIASSLHDSRNIFNAYCLLFTMPGIPSLYYGSEWGIKGKKEKGSDKPLRPNLQLHEHKDPAAGNVEQVARELIKIRTGSEALCRGGYRQLFVSMMQFAFIRETGNEAVLVVLNSSDEAQSMDLFPENKNYAGFQDIYTGKFLPLNNGHIWLENIPAHGYRILSACK